MSSLRSALQGWLMRRSRVPVFALLTLGVGVPIFVYRSQVRSPLEEARWHDVLLAPGTRAERIPPDLRPYASAQGGLGTTQIREGAIEFEPSCSVAHIGGGYAITAGHCVDSARTGRVIADTRRPGLEVQWDGAGLRATRPAAVRVVWAVADHEVDFALLHVRGKAPTVALAVDVETHVEPGAELTMFSHAKRRPLRWSGRCEAAAAPEFSLVHPDHFVAHTCEAAPGSSGGVLLDPRTGRVVAVHVGRLLSGDAAGEVPAPDGSRLVGSYGFRMEHLPPEARVAMGLTPSRSDGPDRSSRTRPESPPGATP